MADKSAIEWTDATWNPIVGCSIVSPGCTNCYAMAMAARIDKMTLQSHYEGLTHKVNGKHRNTCSFANFLHTRHCQRTEESSQLESITAMETFTITSDDAKAIQRSVDAAFQEREAPATRFAKDQLRAIIERIERLEEEKKTLSDDIRDIYAEAKGDGFDVKALRTIVRMRKQDPNDRAEAETILETYMQALGML